MALAAKKQALKAQDLKSKQTKPSTTNYKFFSEEEHFGNELSKFLCEEKNENNSNKETNEESSDKSKTVNQTCQTISEDKTSGLANDVGNNSGVTVSHEVSFVFFIFCFAFLKNNLLILAIF